MAERRRSYEAVAWCYDALARIYSCGAIGRAKAWPVAWVRPGDRVLYVGIGSGEEAVLAARRGARVTGIDLSPRMLRAAEGRFEAAGLSAELLRGDFFEHRPARAYDMVAASFVLDIFSPEELQRALRHLVDLIRPGGWLALSDFAPPPSGGVRSWLSAAYYRPVDLAGWCLGLAALHPIYDYTEHFEALGIELVERRRFALWRRGPSFYESLVASKPEAG